MTGSDTLIVIAVMTFAAAVCRLGGFWFMGFVPMTPRIDAGLRTLPVGVMVGLMVPAVVRGGWPEAVGIGVVMALTKLGLNELIATTAGLGAVAGMRAFGGIV
jgi:uncharacterized membrane protein